MSGPAAVSVVDLGLGNLKSVCRALASVGAAPTLVRGADEVAAASRLVVPGQGAFGDFSRALEGGLGEALRASLRSGTPYFGICLGMQGLFDESDEAPGARGLGHFAGRVAALPTDARDPASGAALKVPHMGWNLVRGERAYFDDDAWFYFVHSYVCRPDDPRLIVGTATYGGDICAAVARDNVFACQFHPEKSQAAGLALMRRFIEV